MATKKAQQPVSTEERVTPFNCPSCGSINEIVKTYGNGKQVLECANCHIDKEKHVQKQIEPLKMNTWHDTKPCSECGSKKRYSAIENGKEVTRCSDCDAVINLSQNNKTSQPRENKKIESMPDLSYLEEKVTVGNLHVFYRENGLPCPNCGSKREYLWVNGKAVYLVCVKCEDNKGKEPFLENKSLSSCLKCGCKTSRFDNEKGFVCSQCGTPEL
jgi:Zn finger protein HypA/HybF involved in hydrogenase expression